MTKNQAEHVADMLNAEEVQGVEDGSQEEHEVFHYWANEDGTITVADFDGLVLGNTG